MCANVLILQGIVVTYDITSIRSFQKLVRWFNYIESHATADVPIMLLGTKADLENRREVLVEDGTKVRLRRQK